MAEQKTPVAEMTEEQAAQALVAAEDARDRAIIAADKARVDVEMAEQDLADIRHRAKMAQTDEGSPQQFAVLFVERLERFLREQPDVAQVDEVADGIFGFTLAGVGDVSLMVNRTGESSFVG